VLSIRHLLQGTEVQAASSCSLFTTKDEAVAFANLVVAQKKNWVIHVAQVPVFFKHGDCVLPEGWTPFNEN
jgi:hypothetical protein